ncbi:MAG: AAA family ATPase [Lachnospiraceae bacterium]|nr:AAA family ATPase [Lachnospiraceae bacterium]
MSELSEAIAFYSSHPAEFMEDILHMDPDDWQKEVALDVHKHLRVAVKSGQGVGKTCLEAGVIIWFLATRPYSRVVCTAPTMQQLYDVLWAELAKWRAGTIAEDLFVWTKTKLYLAEDPEQWFATAKTATKPENMQGYHAEHMLFVIDEASGVAEPIMEAILGTLTGEDNHLLLMGNPNYTTGTFFDAFNANRSQYVTHTVSSRDSKRTSKEAIRMLEDKYGKDSDVVRVRVDGLFPKGGINTFIPLELVDLATEKLKKDEAESKTARILHLGVDVARFGDDKTIIAPRDGNRVLPLRKYTKQDTMETAGNVLRFCYDWLKRAPEGSSVKVKVDDSGVGGGVTDRLKEATHGDRRFKIYGVNNGGSAKDEHYSNLGTELWGNIREALEENMSQKMQGNEGTFELPDDKELLGQLTSRKYHVTSRGRLELERKDDMKKRGLTSPDCADAVALSLYEPPSMKLNRNLHGGL